MHITMRTSFLGHKLLPWTSVKTLNTATVLHGQNVCRCIQTCPIWTLSGSQGYKTPTYFHKNIITPVSSYHQSYSCCKLKLDPDHVVTSTAVKQTFCAPSAKKNDVRNFSQQKSLHPWNSGLLSHRRYLLSQKCLNGSMRTTDFHREFSISPKGILDASPLSLQPYLKLIRFDKPIGTALLFWPCSWSIAMATLPGHFPSLMILSVFGAGSFMMRGAGCIINDMWDRDFDKKVERTKLRPLASGELTLFQALSSLGVMLSGSLALLLTLNDYTVALGASSMILVILYPLAKRYTNWPQLMLGLTFNFGVVMGWTAVNGGCDWSVVLPLYASCILWTLFYDTIYAHQDKYDDMFIGVKSTALYLGDKTKPWLTGFGASMTGLLTLSGYLSDQTWPFYLSVAAVAVHLARQVYTVDLNDADSCAQKFISNSRLGLLMFLGIICGTLMKTKTEDEKESADS